MHKHAMYGNAFTAEFSCGSGGETKASTTEIIPECSKHISII